MSNKFKKAKNYLRFDVDRFIESHQFQLLKVEAGYNYIKGKREENPSFLKALVMITADFSDDSTGSGPNQWAQLSVKLPDVAWNEHNESRLAKLINKRVTLVEPEITVYGDYQNQLSIKVKTFRVVDGNEQTKNRQQ